MSEENVKPYITLDEFKNKHYSDDELELIDLEVEIMDEIIKARKKLHISQKKLEELCGVKQPMIERIENNDSIPRIDTLIKLLSPLGLTLKVVPKEKKNV